MSPPSRFRGRPRGGSAPGRVRITAGRYRGRFLPVPSRAGLRPTTDRMRVQLFAWLEPRLAGARVLDLCAGTGALGCEALSRGAARAVFVERDPDLADALRTSLEKLGAAGDVVTADARRYLDGDCGSFDAVFLDPPYGERALRRALLGALFTGRTVAPGGFLAVEAPADEAEALTPPPGWTLLRRAAYARAWLAVYLRLEEAAAGEIPPPGTGGAGGLG